MKIKELEKVIQQEIVYHRGRRGHSGKTADWEIGFIDGMYHILYLMRTGKKLPDFEGQVK